MSDREEVRAKEIALAAQWIEHRLDKPGAFRLDDEQRLRTILAALKPSSAADAKPVAWLIPGIDHDMVAFKDIADEARSRGFEVQPLYAQPHPSQQAGAEITADTLGRACAAALDALPCDGPEHALIYERDRYALWRIATGSALRDAILAALKPAEG